MDTIEHLCTGVPNQERDVITEMDVDNVTAAQAAGSAAAHAAAVAKLHAMALLPTRQRLFQNHSGKPFTYNGKPNNRGRYTWSAKLGPVPAGYELLDGLPPGATKACWIQDGPHGEFMLWIAFAELTHWRTVDSVLKKLDLDVVYVHGCTRRTLDEQYEHTVLNRLCRTK